MRYILSIILFFLIIHTVKAQNEHIKKIKEHYYSVNEDNYMYHDLELHYMFAAIGEQTKKIRFYFISEQINPEEDPYEMNYNIVKAEIRYNISASVFYTIEYLFDHTGNLMFFFEKKEGYENSEKRYYFQKGKLLKCIVKVHSENNEELEYSDTQNFKEIDLNASKAIISKSARYKLFFNEINKGADVY